MKQRGRGRERQRERGREMRLFVFGNFSLFRICTGLTSLSLCDCTEITEQSIIAIIAMLTSLHTLNLWGCTSLSNGMRDVAVVSKLHHSATILFASIFVA